MFKKLKAGVINMAKQLMENESKIVEAKCELTKYCIEKTTDMIKYGVEKQSNGIRKIFSEPKTRKIAGLILVGLGGSLYLSGYIK